MSIRALFVLALMWISGSVNAQYEQMAEIQFNHAKAKPNGLDVCAGPVALGRTDQPGFNTNHWPIMCNSHINRPEMVARVEEIKQDISSGKYATEDLAKMRAGEIWIGAPKEAAVFALGTPRDVKRVMTKDGTEETWTYRDPLDGSSKALTFVSDVLTRLEER